MQSGSVIEKAKRLGINVDGYDNEIERLQAIADSLGLDFDGENIEEIESVLDERLSDDVPQTDFSASDDLDSLDESVSRPIERKPRFGEEQYNQARDANGVYDKNYYAKRGQELDDKLEKAKEEKARGYKKTDPNDGSPVKPDGSNTRSKTRSEKLKDNLEVAKAKNARFQNKVANAQAKAYQVMHPGEVLKNKAKSAATNAAKNAGKQVGKAAAKAGKAAGKLALSGIKAIASFLAANPIVLFIVIGVILIIFILILVFGGNPVSDNTFGYFDPNCNFNQTNVTVESCNSSSSETMSLEEYVKGKTYSYIKDDNYSDETIKALMVVIKTNALSKGNYSASNKNVTIDDCDKEYIGNISSSVSSKLDKLYDTIEEELFISESYKSSISKLSNENALAINTDILEKMEDLSNNSSHRNILEQIYNENNNEDNSGEEYRETIFVGDSRMTGMKNYGIVNDTNSVYAGAMGYYWFVGSASSTYATHTYNCKSNAIECINKKTGNSSSNIVIWLGVNDISNYEKYYQKYYELATGVWANHYIYITSVGYVDDDKSQYTKNSSIDTFNQYMKSSINASGLKNLIYIDLGFTPEETAAGSGDGIHYYKEFSQRVYDKMIENVGGSRNISTKKTIYKLSNYCTYYTMTENDAYWWPIGSKKATKGNIYGGTPSVTYVSSGYGPRTINGISGFHSGIDIAGSCKDNVIIATRSGTVTTVHNGCPSYGSYRDSCGGYYGNYVILDHGDGTSSVYAHMYKDSVAVKVGDIVNQGQKLGLIGSSGSSTGCHLHFEIRINGSRVNPANYISADNPRPVNTVNLGDVDDTPKSASENKVEICKSLLNSGFSKNAVAGMMVNIQAEGGFRTNNLENCYEENQCCKVNGRDYGFCVHKEIKGFGSDTLYTAGVDSGKYPREKFVNDHAGYGLIQWTSSGRKAGLYDYAKKKGKSIAALSVQLGWLLKEVEKYPVTYRYIKGNYSAYDIANNFCLDFERPANKETNCPARARNNSSKMLQFVKNGCSD